MFFHKRRNYLKEKCDEFTFRHVGLEILGLDGLDRSRKGLKDRHNWESLISGLKNVSSLRSPQIIIPRVS